MGRGAMGVVYKAHDPQIERTVAVKTVSLLGQEPEAEDEFRQRFRNEAQAAGRLHHPGIVAVFDVGEDSEKHDPYIVLEYVAGETLSRLLAREKKLPLEKTLKITEEIAEALDYAHAQGVTHRDIKPGNILITLDGHAKIADFGIAKLNLAHFTVPGKVMGTPAYMAPEQLSGEGADGRSDLFSLGVILYVMLTGHSPFTGNSATTVCFKVVNREPVPASVLDLNLPPEVDPVIAGAMAKNPEERYQRGAELAADLRRLRTDEPKDATTTRLEAISALLTRSTSARLGRQRPAAGLAHAAMLVHRTLSRRPARGLILAVATLGLLVIIWTQSRSLFRSPELTAGPAPVPMHPAVLPASPPEVVPDSATKASAPTKVATRKSSATPIDMKPQAAPRPVKEVIVPLSMVELAVRHQFKEATLSVWVDDRLILTRSLHGGGQKRLVVFGGVRGSESETLKIPAGEHTLRLRARTADQTVDLSKTIPAQMVGGDDKTLLVTFDKHNTAMHLEWQ